MVERKFCDFCNAVNPRFAIEVIDRESLSGFSLILGTRHFFTRTDLCSNCFNNIKEIVEEELNGR